MHSSAGPQVLWWTVAETPAEAALIGPVPLGESPQHRGLTLQGPDAEGCMTIDVLPDADSPTTIDIRLPFFYFPGEVEQAIEVILLGLVGTRMDYYLLNDDVSLTHLGGEWLGLPEETAAELTAMADEALARVEAQYPGEDPFSILVNSRLQHDQAPLMVTGIDNAKSEALLGELTLSDDPELRSARQRLANAEVRRVSAALDGLAHAQQVAADDVARARDTYRALRQKSDAAHGSRFPEAFDGVVAPGRAFVQFAETDDFLSAGLVVHDGERAVASMVDLSAVTGSALRRVSGTWRGRESRAEQEDGLLAVLNDLGEMVVEPILDAVAGHGVNHLVMCPSRALELFPLHAARVGTQRLDDLQDVSYTPSAAVLRVSLRRPSPAADPPLVVASSGSRVPAAVNLNVIAGPAREAALLRAILPDATVRVDDLDATTLLTELARHGVVHLAAHGEGRTGEWDSGLWIGGPTPSAAYLSAAAVLAGPALDAVSLVVLNACQTGVDLVGGVAVQAWRGLDAAFLARGARTAISSLWKIGDTAAAVWSVVFHAERLAGTGLARASKLAADAVRTGVVTSRARPVLDQALPGWADGLALAGERGPLAWAAWRVSGACW
jgi:CHAT domain-containing protein